MHIVCPHCRNPIELVQPAGEGEILCPSCGSSFRLEAGSTTGSTLSLDGRKLGKFELLQTVGVGAFGTVYKARDPELDRIVAIKVPRASNVPGGHELDRFLREARSVAQLRHASIVTVHEVGQVDGTPFLVSDFVEGLTLADWLSAHRPTPRESAELIAQVADALQYAHDRGVVHRDVKPSNIMLESVRARSVSEGTPTPLAYASGSDGSALTPKLMDFGLAKRDAGEITMTLDGQVLGTPAYMSPEQARGEAHRVDGRSDVYSLGVILYQMLTGELPFRGTTRMLLYQVLHDDPASLRKLNDRIPRDLETICLRALAKEPARRYETARGLADDLRRWLDGRPITARPVSRVEKAWRWCRRNPAVAWLSAALGLVILGSLVGLTLLYLNADTERQRAEGAETNWKQAAAEAKEAADESKAVLQFFQNKVLAAPRPEGQDEGRGINITLREALDAAEPSIEQTFANQPKAAGAVRDALGSTYFYLGLYEAACVQHKKALALRRRMLGPAHADTLWSMNKVAVNTKLAGRLTEALPLYEEALRLMKLHLGSEHPRTLIVMNNLANTYAEAGRLAEALPLYEEALRLTKAQLGSEDLTTLLLMYNLAETYREAGQLTESLELCEETLRLMKAHLAPEHPMTLLAMSNLASAYQAAGRLAGALPLHEEALRLQKTKLGPEHPDTLLSANSLGWAYRVSGRVAEAEPLLRDALAKQRKTLPAEHPSLASTLGSLGTVLLDRNQPAEAEPLARECLAIREKKLPSGHKDTAFAKSILGACLAAQKKFAEAEPLLLEGYEGLAKAQGAPARDVKEALARIVQLYDAWDKKDQADEWRQKLEQLPKSTSKPQFLDLAARLGRYPANRAGLSDLLKHLSDAQALVVPPDQALFENGIASYRPNPGHCWANASNGFSMSSAPGVPARPPSSAVSSAGTGNVLAACLRHVRERVAQQTERPHLVADGLVVLPQLADLVIQRCDRVGALSGQGCPKFLANRRQFLVTDHRTAAR